MYARVGLAGHRGVVDGEDVQDAAVCHDPACFCRSYKSPLKKL